MNSSRTTIISKSLTALLLCACFLLTGGLWLGGAAAAYHEMTALCGFFVIAVGFVVLVFHVVCRKKWLIVLDVSALLMALLPLLLHCPFHFTSGQTHKNITLVSWNVDNFGLNSRCLEEMAYIVNSQQPDIICFQERPHDNLMKIENIKAQFPDYPHVVFNDREDEVLNLMVLSKYPVSEVRNHYFESSYNKYMSVDVDVEGKVVRLFNVHLQTTGISDHAGAPVNFLLTSVIDNSYLRNTQADELFDDIYQSAVEDIIVCGDFNSPVFSYSCQTVAKGMNDAAWIRPLSLLQSSFLKSAFLPPIDHVFYRGSLECSDYSLTVGGWTDHKMQKAVFRVN